MATKTPVSILQEFAIKLGYVPLYEEMRDGNVKSFTYSVRCDKFNAKGTALTKKQAKQYAATEMLLLLMQNKIVPQIPEILSLKTESRMNSCVTESTTASNFDTDSPLLPSSPSFTNYVGKVQEYCVEKNLPNPVYEIIDISGEPHCLRFTVSCIISTMYEEASATNKKMAKQNVAKKMWEHIVKTDNSGDNLLKDVDILQVKMEKALALEVYEKPASFYRHSKNSDLSTVPISEHHLLFKNRHSEKLPQHKLLLLKDMLVDTNLNVVKETDKMVKIVNDCFNFTIQEIHITTHKSECKVIAMRIFDAPVIVQFGISETIELARHRAICNIIRSILQFLV